MKKSLSLIAFLLSAGTLLAQFTAQGNFMMGLRWGFPQKRRPPSHRIKEVEM